MELRFVHYHTVLHLKQYSTARMTHPSNVLHPSCNMLTESSAVEKNIPLSPMMQFDRVNAAIDAARAAGGAGLVHCAASISRSAVFLLAYIMHTQKVTLAQV